MITNQISLLWTKSLCVIYYPPLVENPNCLHTILASFAPQPIPQMVPQIPPWQNSTRPLILPKPSARRTSPSLHPLSAVCEGKVVKWCNSYTDTNQLFAQWVNAQQNIHSLTHITDNTSIFGMSTVMLANLSVMTLLQSVFLALTTYIIQENCPCSSTKLCQCIYACV